MGSLGSIQIKSSVYTIKNKIKSEKYYNNYIKKSTTNKNIKITETLLN